MPHRPVTRAQTNLGPQPIGAQGQRTASIYGTAANTKATRAGAANTAKAGAQPFTTTLPPSTSQSTIIFTPNATNQALDPFVNQPAPATSHAFLSPSNPQARTDDNSFLSFVECGWRVFWETMWFKAIVACCFALRTWFCRRLQAAGFDSYSDEFSFIHQSMYALLGLALFDVFFAFVFVRPPRMVVTMKAKLAAIKRQWLG